MHCQQVINLCLVQPLLERFIGCAYSKWKSSPSVPPIGCVINQVGCASSQFLGPLWWRVLLVRGLEVCYQWQGEGISLLSALICCRGSKQSLKSPDSLFAITRLLTQSVGSSTGISIWSPISDSCKQGRNCMFVQVFLVLLRRHQQIHFVGCSCWTYSVHQPHWFLLSRTCQNVSLSLTSCASSLRKDRSYCRFDCVRSNRV